jgi:methylamine dehydrogenase heavy chain
MAPDHHDGSHYHAAKEVWAFDLKTNTLLYRSNVDDLNAVYVTDDAVPVLYGLNIGEQKVYRYDIDPTAKFAAKKVAEHTDFGFATTLTSVK